MKITKETNIAELLKAYPKTAGVFMEFGLHCVGCMAASFDSIEQGAKAHGMDTETLDTLIEDLNLVVSEDADTPGNEDLEDMEVNSND
jgi:hybrid cluster-associated redox disulfide protein